MKVLSRSCVSMEQATGAGPLESVQILYSYQSLGIYVLEVNDKNSYQFVKDATIRNNTFLS